MFSGLSVTNNLLNRGQNVEYKKVKNFTSVLDINKAMDKNNYFRQRTSKPVKNRLDLFRQILARSKSSYSTNSQVFIPRTYLKKQPRRIYNPRLSGEVDQAENEIKELLNINRLNLKTLLEYYSGFKSADVTLDMDGLDTSSKEKPNMDTIPTRLKDVPESPEKNTILDGTEIKNSAYDANFPKKVINKQFEIEIAMGGNTPDIQDMDKVDLDSSLPHLQNMSDENNIISAEIMQNGNNTKEFKSDGIQIINNNGKEWIA